MKKYLSDPLATIADPVYLNIRDEQRLTLPTIVASFGHTEMVQHLVQNGHNLDLEGDGVRAVSEDGCVTGFYATAIHMAVEFGHFDTAKVFQEFGADVNYLLGINKDSYYNWKYSRLLHFAMSGNEKIMRFLFEDLKADPNTGDRDNRTPLLEAVVGNKLTACEILLQAGADINAQEKYEDNNALENGRTPFLCAVRNSWTDIITLFVNTGQVDYSKRLDMGYGAIEIASKSTLIYFAADMTRKGYDVDYLIAEKYSKMEKKVKEANERFYRTHFKHVLPKNYAGTLLRCRNCDGQVPDGNYAELMWKQVTKLETCRCGCTRCFPPNYTISGDGWDIVVFR